MNYKKYSLEKLQEWVHDAMNSDASPQEIYSAIRESVREDYYYHKDCISRASGLLELLNDHHPVADDEELYKAAVTERDYYEGTDKILSCDKDDPSPYCKSSWNNFWEETYYPEEFKGSTASSVSLKKEIEKVSKAGGYEWTPPVEGEKSQYYYDYTRNDPNRKNPFEKKKWVLPIEPDPSGEYFVTFPDDLLDAADLKEGDAVAWIDQGDGSYLLKKVTKPLGMDEC